MKTSTMKCHPRLRTAALSMKCHPALRTVALSMKCHPGLRTGAPFSFASLFAIALITFACADDNTSKSRTQELVAGASLAGTEWVLTGYKNGPLEEPLRNRSIIKFSSGTEANVLLVTGRSFINSYHGGLRLEGATGAVSPVGGIWATKVGGSIEDMQAEKRYFTSLNEVKSIQLNDKQLELSFGDDEVAYFTEK